MTKSSGDPFGLSNRQRRIPASLEVYMSPKAEKSKHGDESRDLGRDMSSSDDITTPVSNTKIESPWNVSRISPQETVSILSVEEERKQRVSLDASNSSSVAASQNMRKQLMQLVTSLQSNLNDSQKLRDQQEEKIIAQEQEIHRFENLVKQLEGQKIYLVEESERKQLELDDKLQAAESNASDVQRKLDRALAQQNSAESERKQAAQLLDQIREENRELHARLGEIEDGSSDFLSGRHKLEREQQVLRERELVLAQKEEEMRQHRMALEQQESQLAFNQSRINAQTENVSRERAQVQSLQKQLMNLQTTQMDLETTHVEEEERLSGAAEELEILQRDLKERQRAFQTERLEHEQTISEDRNEIKILGLQLKRDQQHILTQQAKLEGWEETLQVRQHEIDTETKQLANKEALLAHKVLNPVLLKGATNSLRDRNHTRPNSSSHNRLLMN